MTDPWLEHVAARLGVEATDIPPGPLLDAARVVAHSVERKATPLTTYLIGVAAAREGSDVEDLCRQVIALAEEWERDADGSTS